MNCPCCSNQPFATCCQPLLTQTALPKTPEQLMRSRYTAFVTKNVEYLLTTYKSTAPEHMRDAENTEHIAALQHTMDTTEWLGLMILNAHIDKKNTTQGLVEFVAFFRDTTTQENKIPFAQLHEKSNFILHDNQWLYTTGDIQEDIKMQRNTLCFCGSNKKFKRCHALN